MKNAVVCPETARVAIMQSAPNPAGGILNLIGATRGKLCEKSRSVCGRLSQNSFIQPRHIHKYVQWPPRRICLQEPLWSLVRPDSVDRLFSELAGRALRAYRCFHRFQSEHREFRTVFLRESFCITLFFGAAFRPPHVDYWNALKSSSVLIFGSSREFVGKSVRDTSEPLNKNSAWRNILLQTMYYEEPCA